MSDNEGEGEITPATMQQQMAAMQQLMTQQMNLLRLQMQNNAANVAQPPQPVLPPTQQQAEAVSSAVKRATVPCGRYDMNSHELRTYTKDCTDFQKLTSCTDEQAVLQVLQTATLSAPSQKPTI